MKQQMNFYRPERVVKQPFPVQGVLIGLGVLAAAAVLAFLSFSARQELQQAEQQLVKEQATRDQMAAAKLSLQQKISTQSPDRLLTRELRQLQRELTWKRKAAISAPQIVGNEEGESFSIMLEGLARQLVEGLWLTDISLQQQGREAAIAGGLLRADLLTNFISELQAETAFEGREFSNIEISRPLLVDVIKALGKEERPNERELMLLKEQVAAGVKYDDEGNLTFRVRSERIKEEAK